MSTLGSRAARSIMLMSAPPSPATAGAGAVSISWVFATAFAITLLLRFSDRALSGRAHDPHDKLVGFIWENRIELADLQLDGVADHLALAGLLVVHLGKALG